MSKQLENATNLYLRGIRDGEIKEVHDNYMGTAIRNTAPVFQMKRKDLKRSLWTFSNEIQNEKSLSFEASRTDRLSSCMCIKN